MAGVRCVLQTAAVAFSMFSAIPMPQFAWTERTMRYQLCAFPLVGVVVGALVWAWWAVCDALGLPGLVRGALAVLLPVLVTGGIHLDGYCDTCDALASHAPAERRQQILKDPHVGAFGVIRLACYLLVSFALWAELVSFPGQAVLLGFVLSRSLSGLAVAVLPLARATGLAHTFAQAADRRRVALVLGALALAAAAGMCVFAGWAGLAMAGASLAAFGWLAVTARRQFGGLSGDLNGWFLQKAELWMLVALYAAGVAGLAG